MSRAATIWHEVECGGYEADLVLWAELARRYPGPVLDVGAGSGRVSLRLAASGTSVVALDRDPALLAELERRVPRTAPGSVRTVTGDARDFVSDEPFTLVIVAMQTIQLFGGRDGRRRFLACARKNVAPDGCVAVALADLAQGVVEGPVAFEPDILELEDVSYSSRPVFVGHRPGGLVIERERVSSMAGGEVKRSRSREAIDLVSPGRLADEAAAAGLRPAGIESVPATASYAAAEVVLLHG